MNALLVLQILAAVVNDLPEIVKLVQEIQLIGSKVLSADQESRVTLILTALKGAVDGLSAPPEGAAK